MMEVVRERVESLQIEVTPVTANAAAELLPRAAQSSTAVLVGAHNLHSVYLNHLHPQFRAFYGAAHLILVDGWPVLAALNRQRAKSGSPKLSSQHRIGSTDWVGDFIRSGHITRVCVIGASADSNRRFVETFEMSGQVEFLGWPTDPWNPSELDELVASVSDFEPQLTLVGMGMPLQEKVAIALADGGVPGVIATVGGAIDQLSGVQALAPRWTGALRIEWLWRLLSNPRRLAHRYLVEPVQLAILLRRGQKSAP